MLEQNRNQKWMFSKKILKTKARQETKSYGEEKSQTQEM